MIGRKGAVVPGDPRNSRQRLWIATCQIAICSALLYLPAPAQTPAGVAPTGTGKVTSAIEGRVVTKGANEPVPGIDIYVMSGTRVPSQKTDENGHFRFERLAPGRYGLTVHPMSGYRTRDTLVVLREGEDATGIEISAYAAASIVGRVRTLKGEPLAGLTVSALRMYSAGSRNAPERGIPAITDDLGEYKLTGLNPGRYAALVETPRLSISRWAWKNDEALAEPEPTTANVRTYYPKATVLDLAGTFLLSAGQSLEGIDITVARERTFCVRSRVLDPSANLTDRIKIRVASDFFLGASDLAEGDVGPGDGFQACGLPPGTYRLLANLAGSEAGARYASQPFTLTNRSLRLADISLRPLLPLSGRLTVEAPAPLRPLAGPVTISLLAIGRSMLGSEKTLVRPKELGPFTIPAVLPDEYWLSLKVPEGHYVKAATVGGLDVLRSPLNGAAGDLKVVLGQDAPALVVQAMDAAGHPVAGADVILGRDPLAPSYLPDDLNPKGDPPALPGWQ